MQREPSFRRKFKQTKNYSWFAIYLVCSGRAIHANPKYQTSFQFKVNDHRCVVVHAGQALERLAREVVQQFEDAPGRLVSAGGSSTAARCRGDGGARASARSLL